MIGIANALALSKSSRAVKTSLALALIGIAVVDAGITCRRISTAMIHTLGVCAALNSGAICIKVARARAASGNAGVANVTAQAIVAVAATTGLPLRAAT